MPTDRDTKANMLAPRLEGALYLASQMAKLHTVAEPGHHCSLEGIAQREDQPELKI